MGGYHWKETHSGQCMPHGALVGGREVDQRSKIYVGRAYHEGALLPAKVVPSHDRAYVSFQNREYGKENFEVLCERQFAWIQCPGHHYPATAVRGGYDVSGEVLYIGRVEHQGTITVGKVQPSHRCLYIPFGGAELKFTSFEILVLI